MTSRLSKKVDPFIEVDSQSGYIVRYAMAKDKSWTAVPIRLPVIVSAWTIEQAREKASEGIRMWLEGAREIGHAIPDPESPPEERHLERERFDKAMKQILSVSKVELDRRLAAAKKGKTGKRYPRGGTS